MRDARPAPMQAMRLPFFCLGIFGRRSLISPSEIGGHAFQAADSHGFLIHPAAAAGRFAGPVADAPEDAGEHVGFPVQHIGIREASLSDETDVFGNVGVGRTRPIGNPRPGESSRDRRYQLASQWLRQSGLRGIAFYYRSRQETADAVHTLLTLRSIAHCSKKESPPACKLLVLLPFHAGWGPVRGNIVLDFKESRYPRMRVPRSALMHAGPAQ